MDSAAALRVPGTRGFLLWVRQAMPWVYAEYVRRGVGNILNPALGQYDDRYYMGDVTTDIEAGGTLTTFSDTDNPFDSSATVVHPSAQDPAETAPSSPTTPAQADWLSQIAQTANSFLNSQQQRDIYNRAINTQLSLAQQGRPLMDLSRLGIPTQSGVKFTSALGSSTSGSFMILGGIVVGVLVLSSIARGHRS